MKPTGTTRTLFALALGLALLPGCYLFHGADPGASPGPRRDAGSLVDPMPDRDAGRVDAGRIDAGPPLPAEPDPDLGPDGRPSDYPDADDWEDPPDLDPDAPCCVLGEPREVTSRDAGMALVHLPPLIAWGDGGWGLLFTRYFHRGGSPADSYQAVFWRLDADGAPLGEPLALEMPPFDPEMAVMPEALHHAEGRWSVALSGDTLPGNLREMHARLYDREMRAAGDWHSLPPAVQGAQDLARLTHGDRWVGASLSLGVVQLTPFDELGADPVVSYMAPGRQARLRAVGMRSRIAAVQGGDLGGDLPSRVMIFGAGPEYALLGEVPGTMDDGRSTALAAVRDVVVVASRLDDRIVVDVVDPFGIETVAASRPIGAVPAESDGLGNQIDVAGSDKFGLAGVCWGVPGDRERHVEPSQIMFRLVDETGEPHGRAVTVVDAPFRGSVVNCSVGSDDRGFLVGWWDGSALWVRRVDVAR